MLHLTILELAALEFILKKATHPRSEDILSIVSDELEHEKENIRQKYMRQFRE